jgi:solute:Na+ symporter, SSS family
MQLLDWLIVVLYLALLFGVGVYFSRRQTTLSEFFRGGHNIGWLTVGISLMAALNSALDYVQTPAIVFVFGLAYVAQALTSIPLYPWVSRVTVPFYRRLNVYSAYEYLELRFGVGVRTVASMIFVFWRLGWMGMALYVPCLMISGATNNHLDITWLVIVLGTVVTVYTMLGGIKAVVWTDVAQFCVMFLGLFAALAFIVTRVPGGIPQIVEEAQQAGRLSFAAQIPGWADADLLGKVYLYLTTPVTFCGIIIFVLIGRMASFTSDQVAVQRFQTAKSARDGRNAFIVNAISDVVWTGALGCLGLALFAYYRYTALPEGMQNDRVLPYFMSQTFPRGLMGLVVASIFAASLSSVGAALNSTTSVIVVDFYNRLWLGRVRPTDSLSPTEQRTQVFLSRLVTLGLGVALMLIAANVERLGEIYTVCNKVLGAFYGALFGIFALGMFSRRAHSASTLIGSLSGLMASCFFSFYGVLIPLHGIVRGTLGTAADDLLLHVSWQWPPVVGLATTLLVGYLGSRLLPTKRGATASLTYREVMRMADPGDSETN